MLEAAFNEPDRAKAKELYTNAWNIVSADNPLFPLWYPANMVIYNRRIGNIKMSPSGDWSFAKDLTIQ
jgi:ABC-type transport system substrate-binding protein